MGDDRTTMTKRLGATLLAVLLGALAACSDSGSGARRDDPGWASCIAQGHTKDHCDSKFPNR